MANAVGILVSVENRRALEKLARTEHAITGVERSGSRASRGLRRTLGIGLTAAAGGAAVAVGGLAFALKNGYDEMAEAQKVTAQTNAVLKSTGGIANVTKKHVLDLAGALSRNSGIDDQVVQSGANMLLTFKNIRNEAGKGNKIFDQSTSILADMSTALGTDMPGAAIKLGKALNDPVKGVTALTRVGVTFTDAQKDQITALVDSGRTMDAQKIILRELTSEFGGSAKAAGETFPGQLAKLRNSFDDVTAKLTEKLLPAATRLLSFFSDMLKAPSVDVAAKIAWSGVQGTAGELWDGITSAFQDKVTKGKRYVVEAHRFVTFAKRDPSLISQITESIRSAITGGTSTSKRYSVQAHRLLTFTKKDPGLAAQISGAIAGIDWKSVGKRIGKAIGGAITFSGDALDKMFTSILEAVNGHRKEIAEAGVGIVAAMFVAITSPEFWIENWGLALEVALAALSITFLPAKFLGVLKEIPIIGRLIGPLAKIGKPIRALFDAFVGGVRDGFRLVFPEATAGAEGVVRRIISEVKGLPKRVLGFVKDMGSQVGSFFGFFARDVQALAGRVVDRLISPFRPLATRLIRYVLLTGVRLRSWFGDAASEFGDLAGRVVSKITTPFSKLAGWFAGIFGKVYSSISGKLAAITTLIGGWVATALGPVNSVLRFLHLPTIPTGGGSSSGNHGSHSGNPGAAVQRRAHGGYVVPPKPGGHLLHSITGAPFVAGEAGAEELVLTTDKRHKKRTVALVHDLLNKLGEPPQYALGGWIHDELAAGASAVGSAVSGVAGAASGLADALLHPARWIKAHLPSVPGADSAAGQLVTGVLNHVKDALIRAVTGVVGAGGGASVQRALVEARRIDALNLPYVWGGGHQSSPAPANGPFDCSGFVSHILQYAGIQIPTMTSGSMMGIGSPGRGAGLEVLANPNHVYMKIGPGGYYGTSSYNPGGGPGKLPYGERSGFTIRHFEKGGFVDAPEGQAVPAVVHGGEMVLNRSQQQRLGRAKNPFAVDLAKVHRILDQMWRFVGPRFFPGFAQPPAAFGGPTSVDNALGEAWNGPHRHVKFEKSQFAWWMPKRLAKKYWLSRGDVAATVLHEWAHAFQNKLTSAAGKLVTLHGGSGGTARVKAIREGGAEAFARALVRPTMHAIGMPTGPGLRGHPYGGNEDYSSFLDLVQRKFGTSWILFDQFAHKRYHTKATRRNYDRAFAVPTFDQGGVVPGMVGAPVPAIVHGGETVRTVAQERALRAPVTINLTVNYGNPSMDRRARRQFARDLHGDLMQLTARAGAA